MIAMTIAAASSSAMMDGGVDERRLVAGDLDADFRRQDFLQRGDGLLNTL
jgi:hypothetical protein